MPTALTFTPAPVPGLEEIPAYLTAEFNKLKKILSGNLGNRWEDLVILLRQDNSAKPDASPTTSSLLFPQNDPAEIAWGFHPMPHAWLGGLGVATSLYPVVHFEQAANQAPVFKLGYRIVQPGGTVPAYTTVSSTGLSFTYSTGSIHQQALFAAIDFAGGESGTSTWLDVQLWRDDNVYTGDVSVKALTVHHEVYAIGTRRETSD